MTDDSTVGQKAAGRDAAAPASPPRGAPQNGTSATTAINTANATNATNARVAESKFDVGVASTPPTPPTPPIDAPANLPWGYGDDRITALVRSPDSLYVYWEITDAAIARARARLGAAGEWAWCNLRVYDTTGREFDGVNAHSYFDLTVDRSVREWFFPIDRPSSACHVEVGLKSHEGFFQPIARTGRADFPRKGPSPNHALEWMTVTSDRAHPAIRPYESKYRGPPPDAWKPPPRPESQSHAAPGQRHAAPSFAHRESRTYSWAHPAYVDVRWEGPYVLGQWRTEWRMRWNGTRAGTGVGPVEGAAWTVGPFPVHLLDPSRLEVQWLEGEPQLLEESSSGLEVLGPWQVKINGFEGEPERRVLATWRVHSVRVSPTHVERWWTAFEAQRIDAWRTERVIGGASESRVEVEGGASELWRLGASERWSLGASEWLALGGSEMAWLGASEHGMFGASAIFYGGWSGSLGASEVFYGGLSAMLGASEAVGSFSSFTGGTRP